MGWDAYAKVKRNWPKRRIKNKYLDKAFKDASKKVFELTGSVDGLLNIGGLDCSICGKMLGEATDCSVYGEDLSPEKVKSVWENSNWDFHVEPSAFWAYHSAKEFLRLCANNGLYIEFSW